MRGPLASGTSWRAARPDPPATAVQPWFSLTSRSPSIDSRVGDHEVELSATLATFGGVTGPASEAGHPDAIETPPIVLGGNPVAPGSPAGPTTERSRQCTACLRVAAEGIPRSRQCLVLAAVSALGSGDHHVQSILGDAMLGEDLIVGDDRVALLFDLPNDGHFVLELWLRLASLDRDARLGLRGFQGHLL